MLAGLVAVVTLGACGLAPGVTVPTTGIVLHDCPAPWDTDAIAREVDALVARLPVDTLEQRAGAARAIDRIAVSCEWTDVMPVSLCGPGVHGGCVVAPAPGDPIDRYDVRLAILDRDTGDVEDFCAGFLVVEAAKVAGAGAGLGLRVLERDDVGPAWNAATRPCDPTPTEVD